MTSDAQAGAQADRPAGAGRSGAADTIFALASGRGRAGIAVMRLSGPAADAALAALCGDAAALPAPRTGVLRFLHDDTGERLDQALVMRFPAPRSFTGEDVVELHLHGSPAVVAAVAGVLAARPGVRPAEPGEFSRRAFANGRMDLTAAEGLADLVAAETAAQRRQALRQMGGALAGLYDGWRTDLIAATALVEAMIDFPDDDLPDDLAADLAARLDRLCAALRDHLADDRRGERLRDGLAVAIVGAPNAGKSSLLNRLAGRDAAIVSATAGTTRDVVEVRLDLDGWPVLLADTAGLRAAGDAIEAEGVRRAYHQATEADLKLAVFDAGAVSRAGPDAATLALVDADTLVVAAKADLVATALPAALAGRPVLAVSSVTGSGIDDLVRAIGAAAAARLDSGTAAPLTRPRHRAALQAALQALDRARTTGLADLAAEDLRLAATALGRITGRVDVEEVLDAVFGRFCIGK